MSAKKSIEIAARELVVKGNRSSTGSTRESTINPASVLDDGNSESSSVQGQHTETESLLQTEENSSKSATDPPTPGNAPNDTPNAGQPPSHADGNGASDYVPWYKRRSFYGTVAGTVVGAGAAVVAAPLVVGAMGFGAGGIVAGSIAAQMMSSAAIANGGAIAAGSLVATLQSIGAAGFGAAGLAAVGAAGAGVGAGVGAGAGAIADTVMGSGNDAEGNGNGGADAGGTTPGPEDKVPGTAEESIELNEIQNEPSSDSAVSNLAKELMNLNAVETAGEPNKELKFNLEIVDASEKIRTFIVAVDEPLSRTFVKYSLMVGLSPKLVQFELNGTKLDGSETAQKLNLKTGDVVKAVKLC